MMAVKETISTGNDDEQEGKGHEKKGSKSKIYYCK
jgi:hypothetical protein